MKLDECPRMTQAAKDGRAVEEGCYIELELTMALNKISELESHRDQVIARWKDLAYTAQLDAKRYQYMRCNATFRDKNGPGLYWYLPSFLSGSEADQLDAAIDRMIPISPGPRKGP